MMPRKRTDARRPAGVRPKRRATVDIVGEVRAASLYQDNGGSFTIRLERDREVKARFTRDQEAMVTAALHEHGRTRLHIRGLGEFLSGGTLKKITRVEFLELVDGISDEKRARRTVRRFWEVALETARSIPKSEQAKLPADLAINLDHYLYGAPRVEE